MNTFDRLKTRKDRNK